MRELERYRSEQILTAPPEQLIQMLFDRAVTDLTAVIDGQDESGERRTRAEDIVVELRSALDLTAGEIAHNLDGLYGFVQIRLIDARLEGTTEPVIEARDVISTLREGWQSVVEQAPGLRDA